MEKQPIVLSDLASIQNLNLTITPPEDPSARESRLRLEESSAAHERRKELVLYVSTAVIIAATFGICAYIVLSKNFSGDMDKWATATLASIVTGLVGYVTGRASK